ncbi:hypothetical protein ERD78_05155 [Allopusillimonas soli]|uniref:Uncharacterized protein n=1 Tax=Allopusillimonas soli TaxID=659016 RepID=A0A853FCI0_9BURK|nr:hypothetical protein [Allopusillimonas soli]TEA76576.1 hypothetical protein ERD78_05155 [Allopusillimonas soli]
MGSALFAPTGTPSGIMRKLEQAVREIVKQPDMIARLNTLGIEPIGS